MNQTKNWDIVCRDSPNVLFSHIIQKNCIHLKDIYSKQNFEKPSPIQIATIPVGLASKNIIAQSKSGTGKTVAFLSIAFGKIDIVTLKNKLQVIIVLPTRELANQVFLQARKINGFLEDCKQIKIYSLIGGIPITHDVDELQKPKNFPEIIIGTSGRINEQIKRNAITLDNLKCFIMDEADILVKMKDFNKLFAKVNAKKNKQYVQCLCFSATYSQKSWQHIITNVCPAVKILNTVSVDKQGNLITGAEDQIDKPFQEQNQEEQKEEEVSKRIINTDPSNFLSTLQKNNTTETMENDQGFIEEDISKMFELKKQSLQILSNAEKIVETKPQDLKITETKSIHIENQNIERLKQYSIKIVPDIDNGISVYRLKLQWIIFLLKSVSYTQCLIFFNDKGRADQLLAELEESDLNKSCMYIHGEMSMATRIRLMNKIKLRNVRVIISTDQLSRGIDIESIDMVINLDEPFDTETYFHRIGRAGRFGNYGVSFLFEIEDARSRNRFQQCHKYEYKIEDFPIDDFDKRLMVLVEINQYLSKQVNFRESQKNVVDLGVESVMGRWMDAEQEGLYDQTKWKFKTFKKQISETNSIDNESMDIEQLERDQIGGSLLSEDEGKSSLIQTENSNTLLCEKNGDLKNTGKNLLGAKRDQINFGKSIKGVKLNKGERDFIKKMIECENCKKIVKNFVNNFKFGDELQQYFL